GRAGVDLAESPSWRWANCRGTRAPERCIAPTGFSKRQPLGGPERVERRVIAAARWSAVETTERSA
ncbi:MAG TPA: hypothetical protein VFG00_15030, partial [Acidothermaceae bacterium]|nr:hypothetical protein [Acidothermaceae bacterium]